MFKKSIFSRLEHCLRAFRSERSANVTVTFALAIIPVVGAVGAAVDYSHVNSARTAMQSAVDATALMLSKEAANLSKSQLEQKANAIFLSLYTRPEVTNLKVVPTYSTAEGTEVVVKASGTVKASFVSLIGINQIDIGASSTVKWGNTRLRVALVLDVTGSMNSDGKLQALKTATKNLLDQLKKAATKDGDVYVSIIPFSKDVNIGPENYKATWIDWSEWDAMNGKCSKSKYKNKDSCEDNGGKWTTANHNTWNGCVMDRGNSNGPSSGNYDTNVVAPDPKITATLFAAEQYNSCTPAVMPLNYDWNAMTNLINGLTAAGNTNQGIGLAHGWMSLVGGGPYGTPPAEDPKYKYNKVIILMSDGLNTQNRWYTSASQIDARQKITCDNVKAAGITLYTIHVNTDGDPKSTLLENCASTKDKFWMLTSANQMVETFQQIGTQLSNLRVAK
ncbi:MAG TPA: TadE/TadG family type IV pilus assembly protein [Xanthobacteraceae bacterium]|nr:TadE/TadG family type IV pilus assembly protein [Xanthobacteraceae bacterium]